MKRGKKQHELSDFSIVDNKVLRDTRLNSTDIMVYIALCQFVDGNDRRRSIFPSQDTIADKARCTRRTIIEPLKKLEDLGYIKTQRRGSSSNLYTVLDFNAERCEISAQHDGDRCAKIAQHVEDDVQKLHTNNTHTKNTNKNKEKNINNIKSVAAKPAASSKTLFALPEAPPTPVSRLEAAKLSGDWRRVTDTEFIQYFIDRQNEQFPTKIQFVRGKHMNAQISMFRKNFVDRYQISKDHVCEKIDQLIRAYKQTESDARYRDCFSLDTFSLDWKIDKLMDAVRRSDRYGQKTSESFDTEEVF